MTAFDQQFWDDKWASVLGEHAPAIAQRPPNHHLTSILDTVAPGRALDAGCGHGSEALWLATRGWQVTAVDFAAAALAQGQAMAAALGPEVAARIDWVRGDLGEWVPPLASYDLVSSLYVHSAGPIQSMITRLASGVAPGGLLLLVGHLPIDPSTGAPSPAAGQVQVTVAEAQAVLDREHWQLVIAEDRERPTAGTGCDAVICARCL